MPDQNGAPPAAAWRGVGITFPHADRPAVGPVDLDIAAGERVLLLGPSGSGKSSLLLALTGLIPASVPATVTGETVLFGLPSASRSPAEWSDTVAHYFQDADQVLCGMRVKDEIAFAGENRNLSRASIERRVGSVMDLLGLPAAWKDRRSLSMSGGERQLVALAAIMAQDARLLLADEPTAHLSPEVAERLQAVLARLAPDRSCLIVDHRLDGLIPSVDKVVVLGRSGRIVAQGPARQVFRDHEARLAREGVWRPAGSALDAHLSAAGIRLPVAPLTVAEALDQLDVGRLPPADLARARTGVEAFAAERLPPQRRAAAGAVVAALHRAVCAPFGGPVVLRDVTLAVHAGEIVALLGRNGAGKSTLGAGLAGLLRLKGGRRTGAPGAIALQHSEDHFAFGSVREEIEAMLPKGESAGERAARVAGAIEAYGLAGFEARHPFTLSQGQKRRLVLASIDAADRWPLVVLDEPTAGLDAADAAGLVRRLEAMRGNGRTLVLITHDMDVALRLADRAVIVGDGGLVAEGPARPLLLDGDLLARNGLRLPAAAPALRWLERLPPC